MTPWDSAHRLSIEYECADLLYGLVRMLRPEVCVETGTGTGAATRAILRALADNEHGELWTIDSREYLDGLDPHPRLRPYLGFPNTKALALPVDFAFLDSETVESRVAEFDALQFSPYAIVVLHDALKDSRAALDHIRSQGWNCVVIPSPRGLAICQKP